MKQLFFKTILCTQYIYIFCSDMTKLCVNGILANLNVNSAHYLKKVIKYYYETPYIL
jgi:hypothetical protein